MTENEIEEECVTENEFDDNESKPNWAGLCISIPLPLVQPCVPVGVVVKTTKTARRLSKIDTA